MQACGRCPRRVPETLWHRYWECPFNLAIDDPIMRETESLVTTARIGIAAIAVCRPAPFVAGTGPTISDFMGELVSFAKKEDPADKS